MSLKPRVFMGEIHGTEHEAWPGPPGPCAKLWWPDHATLEFLLDRISALVRHVTSVWTQSQTFQSDRPCA